MLSVRVQYERVRSWRAQCCYCRRLPHALGSDGGDRALTAVAVGGCAACNLRRAEISSRAKAFCHMGAYAPVVATIVALGALALRPFPPPVLRH